MGLIYPRLALGGALEAISVIAISTLTSLMFLYATGSYRRDALLSRTAAVSRVPAALTIAGIVLIAVCTTAFPSYFRRRAFSEHQPLRHDRPDRHEHLDGRCCNQPDGRTSFS